MIMDATERYGNSDLLQKNAVVELEAFAREQQIKGMEAIKAILQAHHSRVWITEQIDAAIQQIKEGGHD